MELPVTDANLELFEEAVSGVAPVVRKGFPIISPAMGSLGLTTPPARFLAISLIGASLTMVWRPTAFFDEKGDLKDEARYSWFLPSVLAGAAFAVFA